jgi:LPXTG-motif cell wall-anchored protein
MRIRLAVAVALAAAALSLVLTVGASALAATQGVSAVDNTFSPKTTTIHTGDTVLWTNNGDSNHTVTADSGVFDSSPGCPQSMGSCLLPGASFSHTYGTQGTFPYHCKIHGGAGGVGMSGTVVVLAVGSPPPSGSPLPNTGASGVTGPFLWLGATFLLIGAGILLALRRHRA